MYSKIVLHVSKERLQTVCVVWDVRFINVLEHFWNGPMDVDIGSSNAVVCICKFSRLLIDGLLLVEFLVVFVQFVQFIYPVQLVVVGFDMADLAD